MRNHQEHTRPDSRAIDKRCGVRTPKTHISLRFLHNMCEWYVPKHFGIFHPREIEVKREWWCSHYTPDWDYKYKSNWPHRCRIFIPHLTLGASQFQRPKKRSSQFLFTMNFFCTQLVKSFDLVYCSMSFCACEWLGNFSAQFSCTTVSLATSSSQQPPPQRRRNFHIMPGTSSHPLRRRNRASCAMRTSTRIAIAIVNQPACLWLADAHQVWRIIPPPTTAKPSPSPSQRPYAANGRACMVHGEQFYWLDRKYCCHWCVCVACKKPDEMELLAWWGEAASASASNAVNAHLQQQEREREDCCRHINRNRRRQHDDDGGDAPFASTHKMCYHMRLRMRFIH